MDAFLLLLLLDAVVCAFACGYLAKQKGKDVSTWGAIGFFLGLIGLLIIGFTPKSERNNPLADGNNSLVNETEPVYDTKKCPSCAETIKLAALKCRFCGEVFAPDSVEAAVKALTPDERRICEIYTAIKKEYGGRLSHEGIAIKIETKYHFSESAISKAIIKGSVARAQIKV
jgi:hypothetical protein